MPTLAFPCTATPLSSASFNAAIASLGVDAATAWAILTVESGKAGYLPDRRPQILFERAIFHRRTNGAYDVTHPGISAPTWGGYSGGAAEYTRLAEAYALSPDDALQSASWGLGQIMGFNFSSAGYDNASDMVQAACASEAAQLQQFVSFLQHTGVVEPLQSQDWTTVAAKYNGPGQVAVYAQKLQQNHEALQAPNALPDLDVRAAQLYLRFLSASGATPAWNPRNIDGLWGPNTQGALNAYQNAQGVAATQTVDDTVLAYLVAQIPAAVNLDLS
jgi:N-acetylmuramidase/Putative peptidoglycan binding domain